jgi:hypothetical protein
MSPDLERVIGRAVTDKKFRDDLLADPEGTVKKAGLTPSTAEMDKLKAGVEKIKKDKTSAQLDEQLLRTRWA